MASDKKKRGRYNRHHEHGEPIEPGQGGGGGDSTGRGGNQPFRALAPAFDTQREFHQAIRHRVHRAIMDQLNPLRQETRQERSANEQREQDLRQGYNWYGNQADQAAQALTGSLNDLYLSQSGAQGDALNALRAAMEQSRAADLAQANIVGGVAQSSEPQFDALLTAAASSGSGMQNLAGIFGAEQGAARAQQANVGLQRQAALDDESNRHLAEMKELAAQKVAVKQQRPDLREEARSAILQEERDAAAQRLQARLAREQMEAQQKQANKDRKQQQEQFESQLAFDYAQMAQQQQQFEDQLAADIQAGELSQNEADDAISKFKVARTQIEDWLKEQRAGKGKGKIRDSEIQHLVHMLSQNYNIPKDIIFRVFKGSGVPALQKWRRNKKHPPKSEGEGNPPGPTAPDGPGGVTGPGA